MKRFRFLVAAAVLLLVCGLFFGAFVYLDNRSMRELEQVRVQVHAAGLPLKPRDLAQPLPPDGQNAAPLYVQLNNTRTANPVNGADKILDDILGFRLPSPREREQLRQALHRREKTLRLIHQAAERPVCAFNRDYGKGASLLLPEYARMRSAARMLQAESVLMLCDGKPLEAVRNNALGFKIAQHAASDPILIANLVGIAIDAITLRGMEQILYAASDQPGVAHAVEQSIAQNWKPYSLAYGMRAEFIMSTVELERLRKAGPGSLQGVITFDNTLKGQAQKFSLQQSANWAKFVNANEAEVLRQTLHIAQTVDKPYWEAHPVLQAAQARRDAAENDPNFALANILMPVYVQAEVQQATHRARAAVARGAASVLAWKQQHGSFPDTLQQAMTEVPADPFDGKPLRYRREGSGFVVYSVGESGKFDGALPARKPDKWEPAFHYPLPAYLLEATKPFSAR